MENSKKKYSYSLPFKNYSARKRNGHTSFDFPYHNIPEVFNPYIRVALIDDIWEAAKLWCEENGFSWDVHNGQGIAPF
jgi:hypothetical protein